MPVYYVQVDWYKFHVRFFCVCHGYYLSNQTIFVQMLNSRKIIPENWWLLSDEVYRGRMQRTGIRSRSAWIMSRSTRGGRSTVTWQSSTSRTQGRNDAGCRCRSVCRLLASFLHLVPHPVARSSLARSSVVGSSMSTPGTHSSSTCSTIYPLWCFVCRQCTMSSDSKLPFSVCTSRLSLLGTSIS